MDPPVQIGQYVLAKNLGIGAFGKVSYEKAVFRNRPRMMVSTAIAAGGCRLSVLFRQTCILSPCRTLSFNVIRAVAKDNIIFKAENIRIIQEPSQAVITLIAATPSSIICPHN